MNFFKIFAKRAQIISVHEHGKVNVFSLLDFTLIKRFKGQSCPLDCFFLDTKENIFITGSNSDSVRLWNLPSFKFENEFAGQKCKYNQGVQTICKLQQTQALDEALYLVATADGSLLVLKLV